MNPIFTIDLGWIVIPDTVVVTLGVSLTLLLVSILTSRAARPRRFTIWQTAIELFVGAIEDTVREVMEEDPAPFVPLIGTLMVFIAVCNCLAVIPMVRPPTADLSTTAALALIVFVAVPYFGIRRLGWRAYLHAYLRPTPLLLPINLIGELSRTLALAVRLFGNVMSGQMIGAVLLVVAGLLVPLPLIVLGLLTGLIQAYIFGVLAAVYIAAAVQVERKTHSPTPTPEVP